MKKLIVLCPVLVVVSTLTMHAQQGARGRGGAPPTPGFARPIQGNVVKGMPYSAEIVTETIQTLGDGNRIVQRKTGRVYRDSEGRVRREEDLSSGSPLVSITDPVAGTSFTLDMAARTAQETPNLKVFNFKSRYGLAGTTGLFSQYLEQMPIYARKVLRSPDTSGRGDATNQPVEERLADRVIEGVAVTGVRRTTTIAKGAIGNEQPIHVVSEEWTAPDLQVLVMTDLNDPRSGRTTYRLLKINRAEPDPALFRISRGFAVARLPARGGGE